jgi:hypothetical protein
MFDGNDLAVWFQSIIEDLRAGEKDRHFNANPFFNFMKQKKNPPRQQALVLQLRPSLRQKKGQVHSEDSTQTPTV